MASPTLLLSALPSMVKGAYLLTNKPKREDYRMRGMEDAFQRMISSNQADIVGKTLLNQTTSSAKSLGARLFQQSQRGLQAGYERGMLTEGQMAQGLLLSGAGIQEKVGEQQQQGLLAQHQASMQAKERLDAARLELGAVKDQAEQNYLAATQQWKSELFGVGMDLAAVGANMAAASWQDKQNADYIKELSQRHGKPFEQLTKDEQYNVMMELYLKASGFDIGTHWKASLKDAASGKIAGDHRITDEELLEVGSDPAEHRQLDIQPGEEFQQRHERWRQELLDPASGIAGASTATQHTYDDAKAAEVFEGYKKVYMEAWEHMKSEGLTPESQEMKDWWADNESKHGDGGGHGTWLSRLNSAGAFTEGEPLPTSAEKPITETKAEEPAPAKEEKKADAPAPLLEAKNIEKYLPEIKDVKFNEDIKITISIEKADFTAARKANKAGTAYDAMFDHMVKMGWDYDSPQMEEWVKSKYAAKGTYGRFKRIYESAMR